LPVPGARLRGYGYAGADPRAPVLLVFGGTNLIKPNDSAAREFAKHASEVILYDYREYGFSTGAAHFETLRSDAVRIFDATKRGYPNSKIVVMGYSMGTAIAEYLAIHRSIHGLILAAPWTDFRIACDYADPKHVCELTPQSAVDFDQPSMVRRIYVPLLVFQGTKDDEIPSSQGLDLEREAASRDKHFVPIIGAKHNRLLENQQLQAAVATFLVSHS
jgi:uncharacterized protein